MLFCSFENRNLFYLFVSRTRDSNSSKARVREAHSRSTTGLELHSGGFLILMNFFKIFYFDPLCHVVTSTLDLNIVTLSSHDVPTSRR